MMQVVNHHSERQLQLLADQEPRADIAKPLRTIVLAKRSSTSNPIELVFSNFKWLLKSASIKTVVSV